MPTVFKQREQAFYGLAGQINTVTGEITYYGTVQEPTSGNIWQADTNAWPFTSTTGGKLTIGFQNGQNKAGERMQIDLKVTRSGSNNDADEFAAAMVIYTDWELWVDGQSYISEFDTSTEAKGYNCPLSLQFNDWQFSSNQKTYYMTYIPMVGGSMSGGKLTLYNVFMPYSHDITSYYLYVT